MHFSTKSPIVFGAGAFNDQYNCDPELADVARVLEYAFDHGITTIDTAAAYGPSEEILGKALEELKVAGYPRSSYRLCSKCCRWENRTFEFSREVVLKSVARSLERLKTDYLDILYVHDVEFGKPDDVMEAILTAFELKKAGQVREVGISGYPLDVLATCAKLVQQRLKKDGSGQGLDVVLSYCNLTLQNDLLLKYKPVFEEAGVKQLFNASPLSMSLLRSRPTHGFHPAQKPLLDRATQIGAGLLDRGVELADAATQYSFARWPGPTVIGLRTVEEVEAAIRNREKGLSAPDNPLWDEIIHEFGEWHNATWRESGTIENQPFWDECKEKLSPPS